MSRALALDVGNRRIGVAISDAIKMIARPLCVIDRKEEDATARVVQLCSEQQVDEIVVGYPLHTDGSVSEQAKLVEQFANTLRDKTNATICFIDESHSTQDAAEIIAQKKRKQQPQHDDAIAAAVILQRFLDENDVELLDE
jgi:putative Holliday junction resolvase